MEKYKVSAFFQKMVIPQRKNIEKEFPRRKRLMHISQNLQKSFLELFAFFLQLHNHIQYPC